MKALVAALIVAVSVLANNAAPASAGTAVGPPTLWHPVDPSSSPH
jgi:hypothetical protein